jgi:hypothetical protein
MSVMSKAGKKCDKTYTVGYGKPPVHSQFCKGQSGNPSGRPHSSVVERAKALVRQEAYRKITVRDGDKVVKMTALQAVLRAQFARAAKGSVAAQREISNRIQAIEAETLRASNNKSGSNDRLEDLTNEQLDERIKDALKMTEHIQKRFKNMGLD